LIGGELRCRVCGLPQDEPIWWVDGQKATFNTCACCGCEFGVDDCSLEAIRRHREKWIATKTWFDPTKKQVGWESADQLSTVSRFYLRVLHGLPGTGEPAVQFNVTGTGLHSEGFVVEFTCASANRWVGNFQLGIYGASGALAILGRTNQALVIARGLSYIVDPESESLVRTFGGEITDVFALPQRDSTILGNGLWFECNGPDGLRWRTRRISWDGMMSVSLDGERLHGHAFNPIDDTWAPFDVDIDSGEVTGGSYPPELPQP
jgi:hypothetical protein